MPEKLPSWTLRISSLLVICACAAAMINACTMIAVALRCPGELAVGERAEVRANEVDPGAIPSYLWQVQPSTAGAFTDPTAANTEFQALEEGQATIQLIASDGLFQVVDQCEVTIAGMLDLAVSLSAAPEEPFLNEPVTLTCTSVGASAIEAFTITQSDGFIVTLNPVSDGVVRFEATRAGDYTFICTGTSGENTSQTATVNLTVFEMLDGNANENSNANSNENGNENGNANQNENGAMNANGMGTTNANDNGDAKNGNKNDNGGRV